MLNRSRLITGAWRMAAGGSVYALHPSYMHRIGDFTAWGKCKARVCGALLPSGPKEGHSSLS